MTGRQDLDWPTRTRHVHSESNKATYFGVQKPSGNMLRVCVTDEFLEGYAPEIGESIDADKDALFDHAFGKIIEIVDRKYWDSPGSDQIVVDGSDL